MKTYTPVYHMYLYYTRFSLCFFVVTYCKALQERYITRYVKKQVVHARYAMLLTYCVQVVNLFTRNLTFVQERYSDKTLTIRKSYICFAVVRLQYTYRKYTHILPHIYSVGVHIQYEFTLLLPR